MLQITLPTDEIKKTIQEALKPIIEQIDEKLRQLEIQTSENRLLSPEEVAKMLSIGKSTIYDKLKNDPNFPKPEKIGKVNRWKLKDIQKYMNS